MVGPPSSWSLRDQEDASWQLRLTTVRYNRIYCDPEGSGELSIRRRSDADRRSRHAGADRAVQRHRHGRVLPGDSPHVCGGPLRPSRAPGAAPARRGGTDTRHIGAPSLRAEALHFLGEVEVVFGLWAVVLLVATTAYAGWEAARHYVSDTVNYTEPLFVVVIMALASTRPVIGFAESALRRVAAAGGATPAAWWAAILTIGPVLGSFITEPAAMTICALLLARQFFDLQPSTRLKYATLGVLFVNVSIGGTLTQFAAPPVLMVARPWGWDIPFMVANFGWRAVTAILVSTAVYFILFRKELGSLAARAPVPEVEQPDDDAAGATLLPVPPWVVGYTSRSWRGPSSTRTIQRCSLAAFCSSWALPAPRRRIRAGSN